ncbi:hypothetical protein [Corallococcus carmarthensis]|uniref:hypothetical protein n=1 Tax=Corallococcus carmarthensis TaxID=2316728 RepID=UPI0011C44F51|nr:hypothetical protein [Corallococcus carmarthensis]
MALQDLTSREAVLAAIAEFREIGREAFLQKYGYGEARSYFLSFEGELFDSKAIVGAAHGFQHPKPLANTAFSGGDATVRAKLESLGFNVVSSKESAGGSSPRPLPSLEPGRIYSWDELGNLFDCEANYFSSVGGMASRPEMQALLLITHIGGAKSFDYEDYWDGDELIYTGRGQTGDQRMDGQNKLLASNRYTNFMFEGAATRLLRFLGVVRSTQHWWSTGPDSNGTQRRIIRFRLRFNERAGATTAAPTTASRRARRAPTLTPRPFDETRVPSAAVPGEEKRSPEETLALKEKAVQGHFHLVAALNRALLSAGWQEVREIPTSVDLWGRRPGDGRRVIFEVKTLGERSEVDLTRDALSQLLEYRHFRGEPDDLLCLVMNAPVSDARERFLRSQGVAVLTYDGTGFEAAGPLALEMVGTLVEQT